MAITLSICVIHDRHTDMQICFKYIIFLYRVYYNINHYHYYYEWWNNNIHKYGIRLIGFAPHSISIQSINPIWTWLKNIFNTKIHLAVWKIKIKTICFYRLQYLIYYTSLFPLASIYRKWSDHINQLAYIL